MSMSGFLKYPAPTHLCEPNWFFSISYKSSGRDSIWLCCKAIWAYPPRWTARLSWGLMFWWHQEQILFRCNHQCESQWSKRPDLGLISDLLCYWPSWNRFKRLGSNRVVRWRSGISSQYPEENWKAAEWTWIGWYLWRLQKQILVM